MTDDEHAEWVARIKAGRVAAGRSPYIESPKVYLLLAAVLRAHADEEKTTQE